jgi:hypothetical protein
MAFCHNCGAPLEAEARFCGSCGHSLVESPPASVQAPQPQPVAPPPINTPAPSFNQPVYASAPPGERILGAVPVVFKKSMFSQESYHIIVTERRLVVALATNEMLKEEAKKQSKGGFMSGMVGSMTIGFTFYKRYLDMDPDIALRENPQNYQIDRNQISRVRLQIGSHHRDPQRHTDNWGNSKLDIEAAGMKYSFEVVHFFHDMAQDVFGRARLI